MPPPPFETARGARVRRNPWIMALAASPFFVAIAALIGALAVRAPPAAMFTPHLLGLGTAFTILAWRKNLRSRDVPGKLVADERGLSFGGALLIPKAEIKSGLVLPRADGPPIVRFRRRGLHLPVDIRVPDREEGRAMLRALGLDASQSVATFRLPSGAFADPALRKKWGFFWGGAVALYVLSMVLLARSLPQIAAFLPISLAAVGIGAAILSAIPTRLQVGADGLHTKWLRRARFIGYGEVDRIDPFEDPGSGKNQLAGLELTLKGGEKVRIPVMSKRSQVRDEIYLLHERIAEAIETWSRGEGVAHAALVRRSGREASQWMRALRGIGAFANADARTAPVMPEKLWRIVEDPAAPADARAGAAVALGHSADDDARARLRAAASATAAPKLRFAIETAATQDAPDDALAAALAEVESEAPRPPQRA